MTTNVNFDELAKKAFAPDATSDDYENLFAAAFSLPDWYFVADGEFSYKMPYCAMFPDYFGEAIALTVFTDGERAGKFIAEKGITPKPEDSGNPNAPQTPEDLILRISTTGILDFFDKLEPLNVTKIFFNPNKDSHGFHHDLKMMRPIYGHLENKGRLSENVANPPETETVSALVEEKIGQTESNADFDLLSKTANGSNGTREDLNELFGEAFALEKWDFIARGEMPNVNPYIASRADVADGQQMIRAFTDGARLQRFAKENNLTREDGSVDILSIPTAGIVEYLEGFMTYGVHGVWFNSDVQSDGFFIPIKQLQPIKDHLAKINWQKKGSAKESQSGINSSETTVESAESEHTMVVITISDGLMLPSGSISKSSYNCNFFCWLPREWTENLQLKAEHLEKLYEQFYGASWRSGNSDGSRYVVLKSNSATMSPERSKETKWNVVENTELNHYWFYIADTNGTFKNVSADEFQAHFDAYFQEEKQNEARERQDRLADWGMSQTPDGEFDLNLSINKVGAVNFDASIAPFYEAIVPLLKDFQGTGDYVTLLRFEPSGKSQEVENVVENAHGAYLQIRRFVYLNPKNGVRIGVNSIHSSYLRHVQSSSELIVSVELCKNLDNQTGVLYHAFQGPKSDVLNLMAAIQPILDSIDYQAVQ